MRAYLCYVYESEQAVPHFEVVPACDDDGARRHALELLRQRPSYRRVELWEEERWVGEFTLECVA